MTQGGKTYDKKNGFSKGDIKERCAYSEKTDTLCFGSVDSHLYIVNRKDGTLYTSYKTHYGVYATPVIDNERVIFSSADKHIYCFDIVNKALLWKFYTGGRIFAEPTIIEGVLYCGSNDGRLYEIDIQTGTETGRVQFSERIVNKPVFDTETKTFFIPTVANEIYSLKKNGAKTNES